MFKFSILNTEIGQWGQPRKVLVHSTLALPPPLAGRPGPYGRLEFTSAAMEQLYGVYNQWQHETIGCSADLE